MNVKKLLDAEAALRNISSEINQEKPDPILVAHKYKDPAIALICALFAYGNVKQIMKFLNSLDFSLLHKDDTVIENALQNHYYRFQTGKDIVALFIALKRLHVTQTLEEVFQNAYNEKNSVIDGVNALIEKLNALYAHNSRGYTFLLSKISTRTKGAGALKRWMMFLRWMVRDDNIDMGLWKGIDKADLIMPLDTHTFNVSRRLGLLQRNRYDLQAAIELTQTLKTFDATDPLKYDFALYRIGQEKIVWENDK